MSGSIEARLADLGIALPTPAAPVANYVPYVEAGGLLFVSGQVPFDAEGKIAYTGKVGTDVSIEDGQQAARLCAINILAQAKAALGDLDKLQRLVKLGGFVNSAPDFGGQPQVINGASDLFVEVLGDKGRHARFAVSAPSLPLGCAVEIDAIFQVS